MDGSGTYADPWRIRTVADLELLSGDGYASYIGNTHFFNLENDIDFEGATFTPIGTASYRFNGRFNGKGHTISNMVISTSTGNSGFLSYIGSTASIGNINFVNCSVTDTSTTGYVGMVAGRGYDCYQTSFDNIGTYNCEVIAENATNVGGIVGYASGNPRTTEGTTNYTRFLDCHVSGGLVQGKKYVGGIAGYGILSNGATERYNHTLYFSRCTVTRELIKCTVSSTDNYCAGILAGGGTLATSVEFYDCTFSDSVISNLGNASAGIIGYTGTNQIMFLSNCKVVNVLFYTAGKLAAGLIQHIPATTTITVTDCVVDHCTIRATQQVGGFFSRLIENSSAANWTVINPTITHNYIGGTTTSAAAVGGFIGYITRATSGTVTGGTQDCNNVVGSLGTYGVNLDGYTNQVANAAVYVSADSVSVTIQGRRMLYSFTNERGSGMAYNSDNRAFSGYKYDPWGGGYTKYRWYKWYQFESSYAGRTYTPKVTVRNSIYQTGTTLTSTNSITVGTRNFISNHDRSFFKKAPDMVEVTTHDESLLGVI